ncbi:MULTISPECIES: UDP-N-acetylmuramoyl-L-alanine--D-glutamate ligase [unclassified Nodularia (in: cyanobacteria)]|uniref:UDP-N-acetylmuramoyl-L-alanine--D-glutamate ligase n=1 Tax=unclassified Nodularia (in: cyanobacteria) TaxID=2656917 RepID=UPI001882FE4C|nr:MULTISPECIES: UDP-N-acetylmuramoyl-L-alanine--D-glutamate ligase [unclassified Nodularia (in: cyanobacteria)]MBE9200024.1 UDP-N-acetylmuramoyl-L-alanine--D-glutamate ligase [Nodularia sp. LEGE 06071]MCC2695986.1 UDP-N-acetylmuramoyl-L-alanine--D-glutamate ligase [Nodularia sp. LEGE 04288]
MPRASVIGLGKSGVATARLLKREGWEVVLSDSNTSSSLLKQQQELATEQITVKLGHSLDLDGTDLSDLIVVSPGVPWDIPVLVQARELGIETIGEMELAWRYLQASPWVGITGTNGKTTTTALIAAIFQAAGLNAPACGNIGYAACEVALSEKLPDWVIAEISSYQIESSVTLAPRIGIWTTFTPDHLPRHKTLENYYNIKAKLLNQSHLQIFNGDDSYLNKMGITHWPDAYWTSVKGEDFLLSEQGFYIEDGWVVEKLKPNFKPERLLSASALRMVGEHNLQNLLMAVAAARLAGIETDAIDTAIRNFSGVPHRLEHICTWEGIDFINDSKATNYDAAEVGLVSVNSPAILIAGGEAKPGDDTGWLAKIQAKAAVVLLIGSAAPAFAQRLQAVGYSNYEIVETMDKAVSRSAELAQEYHASVVLLSPACASFDQYPNFEARGDDFRQLCLAWVG